MVMVGPDIAIRKQKGFHFRPDRIKSTYMHFTINQSKVRTILFFPGSINNCRSFEADDVPSCLRHSADGPQHNIVMRGKLPLRLLVPSLIIILLLDKSSHSIFIGLNPFPFFLSSSTDQQVTSTRPPHLLS